MLAVGVPLKLGNNPGRLQAAFGDCPLWIAHYTTKPSPDYPHPWVQWSMWQYAETGRVAGVSYPVDVDRFNGTDTAARIWEAIEAKVAAR